MSRRARRLAAWLALAAVLLNSTAAGITHWLAAARGEPLPLVVSTALPASAWRAPALSALARHAGPHTASHALSGHVHGHMAMDGHHDPAHFAMAFADTRSVPSNYAAHAHASDAPGHLAKDHLSADHLSADHLSADHLAADHLAGHPLAASGHPPTHHHGANDDDCCPFCFSHPGSTALASAVLAMPESMSAAPEAQTHVAPALIAASPRRYLPPPRASPVAFA